jgi:hypothetical protein
MWVRQVDWEPDELARVFSQSFLFHPRDRMCRLFFASCGKVHLGAASHEMKCDVQTDTRTAIPKGWPSATVHADAQRTSLIWEGRRRTYFAPVTMATRPCKSSRSFPGEMFDAELPIYITAERKGGGLCHNYVPGCILRALGFMDAKTARIRYKSLDKRPEVFRLNDIRTTTEYGAVRCG